MLPPFRQALRLATLLGLACISLAATQPAVENTLWRAVEVGGEPIAPGSGAPNLELFSDGHRVSSLAGCNRLVGTYTIEGHALRFESLATTGMMCPDPIMRTEARFLASIDAVRSWQRNGSQLDLLDEKHTVVLRLATDVAGSPGSAHG